MRNQQVARIDYENDEDVSARVEERAGAISSTHARMRAGAIVVSDYLKGVVTRRLMAHVVACGQRLGAPVLVDPKIPHLEYYAGASLVTPNHHEAEAATHVRIRIRRRRPKRRARVSRTGQVRGRADYAW